MLSPIRVLVPQRLADAAATRPPSGSQLYTLAGATMGTRWMAQFIADGHCDVAPLRGQLQAQFDRVVAQMSGWEPGSDLWRFNHAPAGHWQRLPEEFFAVLRYACQVASESDGAFDPAAGALVNLWGFGPEPRPLGVPHAIQLRLAQQRSGWHDLRFDEALRRVLQPGGVCLDLCAVARGFAVDLAARSLEAHGLTHYLVEIGGELRGQGCKPDGAPWWVELEPPPQDAAAGAPGTSLRIALDGLAIATSGDCRGHFPVAGRRHTHTIDPRTGAPVAHGLVSVSVIHASCMAADALSTAISVLGPERGLAWAEQRALAARLLIRRGQGHVERLTTACEALLQ